MNYLDTNAPYINFKQIIDDYIYVDKSMMIEELSDRINRQGSKYICITRPRRFGKTVNANMLGAYYTQGYDGHALFDNLLIAKADTYEMHLNKHHVIYIDLSRMPDECENYKDYINDIRNNLREDLYESYPELNGKKFLSLDMMLNATNDSFIFILDEWDSIFYKNFMTENDKNAYLNFLTGLLKSQPYVELAYMTGVLPILSSGSALNMFEEYNFMNDNIYEDYFGFNEAEVKELCETYTKPTYEELKYWYDGYKRKDGSSVYNPRSVSSALVDGECLSFWTETGPMNEIAKCIDANVNAVKNDIVNMVSNIPVNIKLRGYGASNLNLKSRDNILSAMVVYGFLTYRNTCLQIPNHELMLKFEDVLTEENLGEIAKIVNNSENMLKATIHKDTETVEKYLREMHATEMPLLKYNDENAMSCAITLCYLKARDYYRITRKQNSGEGLVDFLFHPQIEGYPAIVLVLKKDHSADEAIKQIKETNYIDEVRDCDKILLVGINYNSNTKEHTCIIEEYSDNKLLNIMVKGGI